MSAVGRVLSRELRKTLHVFKSYATKESRSLVTTSTNVEAVSNATVQKSRKELVEDLKSQSSEDFVPPEYRFMYPEFLPDPKPEFRNRLREKLERMDMMARRAIVDIPEFYVGSIVAVTYCEPHAPGKTNRFLGICIERTGCGLRAKFVLRNVIDHQGIDVIFEVYDPNIQKIDCIRLEKRLDDRLAYLRDAPPEYSTFPLNMEPELLPEGSPVPVNDLKVPLKPKPWIEKWERQNLKGVKDMWVNRKRYKKALAAERPWEKYDLMKIYRETIPEEEQKEIYAELHSELHSLEISRRKLKRKRSFVRPKKTA
ncbi:39S ribosomal protein L19, mitochondrial [Venturia canescens]|uniref:39S ribosomal protein L19, mitochondrial n=1 Tax=Venturia canescens TaxID=32260 RepID=UPI001C9C135E|nr:39S ribosomal protein L19, mitochondrial [Venturia canescens]